ncbi:MAG: hypothetical protein HOQ05_05245 [Corynebacteriales bacterium]|nr:hypothetical protein [Mycobacteriales bacterium]
MTSTVNFYFDPSCPWTWVTSRWLVEVANHRELDIQWRAFSLEILNADNEVPEKYVELQKFGHRALRPVAYLTAQNRNNDVAEFYTALGAAVHVEGERWSDELIAKALRTAGAQDAIDAIDDPSYDAKVAATHEHAYELAGPDVGAPIIELLPGRHAIFGPVLAEIPRGEDAVKIFDATVTLTQIPAFKELKRGRTADAITS